MKSRAATRGRAAARIRKVKVAAAFLLAVFTAHAASQSQAPAQPNAALPPAAQTPVTVDPGSMPQALPDSLRADSLAARRAPSRADTTLIVKHRFNHRQQIIAGSAIMASLAMVMVVMNNYNPRGPQD